MKRFMKKTEVPKFSKQIKQIVDKVLISFIFSSFPSRSFLSKIVDLLALLAYLI